MSNWKSAASLAALLYASTAYAQNINGNVIPPNSNTSPVYPAFSPLAYGAICNNNIANAAVDTAGIQLAIAAAAAAGGGEVSMPNGVCFTNATIIVPYNNVQLVGQGENASTMTPTGAFDAIVYGDIANSTVSHVGMRDMSIIWASIPASGNCFRVNHVYYAEFHNVFCQNPHSGMAIGPSYFGRYDNVFVFSSYAGGSTGDGLYLYGDQNTIGSGTHPVSNSFNDLYFLSPVGGAFNHVVYIASAEHTDFKNLYVNGANSNDVFMNVQSTATATSPGIQNTAFSTVYVDNNAPTMGCGFYILGNANGNIVDTKISNMIAAGEVPFVGSGTTQGVCIDGTTPYTISDTKIVNANIYDWQASGLNIQTAANTQLSNVNTQNNNALNTTAGVGLDIGPNVVGLIVTNLRAGGTTYGASLQTYGVYLESGAQNVVIDGGNVTGNVTAGLLNLNSVTTAASTINLENLIGFNGARAQAAPAVPASTVNQFNPYNAPATVIVSGGTVSAIGLNGTATGLTSGSFILGSQDYITLTYTVAPSWKWWPQ